MAAPDLSVIVLTWNNLPLTRRFVDSVRLHTLMPYELIVVDNGSEEDAVAYGREIADTFISNETNRGFAVGMNQGLTASRGRLVAFCNNDTVVPADWDTLLARTASRPRAGLVVPALTAATNSRTVRAQPGTDVEVLPPFSAPPAGAFVVMATEVAREIGGWGEEYAIASGEDVDLAFKVWVNDLDLLYDTRVLVEHLDKGSSRNLENWQELWRKNRQVFLDKWTSSPAVPRLAACAPRRHSINLATAVSVAGWMSQYFRTRDRLDNPLAGSSEVSNFARTSSEGSRFLSSGSGQTSEDSSNLTRLRSLWTSYEPPVCADALRIRYCLPTLRIAGGILGVMQLVNELRLLGADASIVALADKHEVYRWRFLHPPTIYRDEAHLREAIPETDVLVATHWSTARAVHDLVNAGRARVSVYFLQDYEAWFFAEDDLQNREIVRETYDLIEHKIVKSDWLASLLERDGHHTYKIPLGMDHGLFYPRPVPKSEPPLIMAMGRPRTPRRGFDTLTRAFEIVHRERPDVQFVLFGQDLKSMPLPFPYHCEGLLTNQERLAQLYSSATVHVDASDFQAFGRPALESMACGTASVLTEVGGVIEYARSGENCLLVPAREPRLTAEAILRLLRDEELRRRIVEGGLRTVLGYSMRREARDTFALFHRLLERTSAPPLTESRRSVDPA